MRDSNVDPTITRSLAAAAGAAAAEEEPPPKRSNDRHYPSATRRRQVTVPGKGAPGDRAATSSCVGERAPARTEQARY